MFNAAIACCSLTDLEYEGMSSISESWGLLLTDCSWNCRSLPVLSSLLNSEDLALRTAAGESIALLYEMTNSSGFAGDVEDSVDDIVPPVSRPSNSSVSISLYVVTS